MATSAVIEKVVIYFLENHTYDNLASDVSGGNGETSLPLAPDVMTHDPDHSHDAWNVRAADAPRLRYERSQVPLLYGLMDAYTVCDSYFSDVTSLSFPNHAFAIGADAEWGYLNPSSSGFQKLVVPGVPARLDAAGLTWGNYGGGFAFPQYVDPLMHQNVKDVAHLATDAANGALPDVSWVYAPSHEDFHPGDPKAANDDGSSMSQSDAWLGSSIRALTAALTPNGAAIWDQLAIFITFDDWGGWFDHVPSPNLEQFPASHPKYPGQQYRYGPRVPCVVVSPYAKPAFVSHVTSSHTSLVAFIERRFGLPPSPSPDAARRTTSSSEQAMADCFDYSQTPIAAPAI